MPCELSNTKVTMAAIEAVLKYAKKGKVQSNCLIDIDQMSNKTIIREKLDDNSILKLYANFIFVLGFIFFLLKYTVNGARFMTLSHGKKKHD